MPRYVSDSVKNLKSSHWYLIAESGTKCSVHICNRQAYVKVFAVSFQYRMRHLDDVIILWNDWQKKQSNFTGQLTILRNQNYLYSEFALHMQYADKELDDVKLQTANLMYEVTKLMSVKFWLQLATPIDAYR